VQKKQQNEAHIKTELRKKSISPILPREKLERKRSNDIKERLEVEIAAREE
jgi:hypothetical protein